MQLEKQVIAVAGVGDVGRYLCEELLTNNRFDVVVISRSVRSILNHILTVSSALDHKLIHPSTAKTMVLFSPHPCLRDNVL